MPWNNIPRGFKLAHRLHHHMEKGIKAWRQWEWISSSSIEPAAQEGSEFWKHRHPYESRLLYSHAGAANTESHMTLSAPLFPMPEWIFYLNKTNSAVRTAWQPAELQTQCSTDTFWNNTTECTQDQIQNYQKGLESLNTKQGSRQSHWVLSGETGCDRIWRTEAHNKLWLQKNKQGKCLRTASVLHHLFFFLTNFPVYRCTVDIKYCLSLSLHNMLMQYIYILQTDRHCRWLTAPSHHITTIYFLWWKHSRFTLFFLF